MTPGAPPVMPNFRALLNKIPRGFRAVLPVLAIVLVIFVIVVYSSSILAGLEAIANAVLSFLKFIISAVLGIAGIILAFALYFAPTIVANRRKHKNYDPIFLVNLLFGWMLIGWIIALIWSFSDNTKNGRHKGVVESDRPLGSLVVCPMCGKQISPQAAACPGCGHPQERTDDIIESGTDK